MSTLSVIQQTDPAPPSVPTDAASPLPYLIGFSVGSVVLMRVLGVFRRRLIEGPVRLCQNESAWVLLVILCGGYLVGARLGTLVDFTHLGLSDDVAKQAAGAFLSVCVAFMLLALTMVVRPEGVRCLGLEPRKFPRGFAIGCITFVTLYPVVMLTGEVTARAFKWVHREPAKPHELLRMLSGNSDRHVLWIVIAAATVAAPLFEELFFRGFIQTMLTRLFGFAFGDERARVKSVVSHRRARDETSNGETPAGDAPQPPGPTLLLELAPQTLHIGTRARWAGVVMTSGLFAYMHFQAQFFPPLFLLALGMGYAYERTGNLWVTITTHGLFNLTQILVFRASSG